jgi:hypothetical protein
LSSNVPNSDYIAGKDSERYREKMRDEGRKDGSEKRRNCVLERESQNRNREQDKNSKLKNGCKI